MDEFRRKLIIMHTLESVGIVKELMPEHDGHGGSIWSWEVLKPEQLPDKQWIHDNLKDNNGIIRL